MQLQISQAQQVANNSQNSINQSNSFIQNQSSNKSLNQKQDGHGQAANNRIASDGLYIYTDNNPNNKFKRQQT
jgi:hypothetical protein